MRGGAGGSSSVGRIAGRSSAQESKHEVRDRSMLLRCTVRIHARISVLSCPDLPRLQQSERLGDALGEGLWVGDNNGVMGDPALFGINAASIPVAYSAPVVRGYAPGCMWPTCIPPPGTVSPRPEAVPTGAVAAAAAVAMRPCPRPSHPMELCSRQLRT
jgi:hypothetical protein